MDDYQLIATENGIVVDVSEGGAYHVVGHAAFLVERATRRCESITIEVRPKPVPE